VAETTPGDGGSDTTAYVLGGLGALALALAGGFVWYRRRLP
jgi:LPXTG-motif cell wall-anchored protein